tara:strand:+ start:1129 stop:1263 length:135 start_codon:yes stop_codon:yes gene_type:complete
VSKEEALEILQEIKDNVYTCCAVTMDPDEVEILIEKLEEYIKNE